VRLAQALERMEAAAETLVDADDEPHLAAVRRLARRVRHGTLGDLFLFVTVSTSQQ